MELAYEYKIHADLDSRIVGPGPYGTRVVFSVTGGWAEGARIRGKVVGAGGDWMLVGPDGYGRLDVRGQLETDDGATIYFSYGGLLERNAKVQAASASRGQTGYDDQYFRITPRLETGDARYAWVNQTLFVARGRLAGGAVEYEVFRLT